VDTRTGRLACVLEENYCFDAEMYMDELRSENSEEFKDDQRGKSTYNRTVKISTISLFSTQFVIQTATAY
jgi:hypothetical protein